MLLISRWSCPVILAIILLAPELKIWPSNAELRNTLRKSLEHCSEPRRNLGYRHRNRPNGEAEHVSSRSERRASKSNKNHFFGLSYDPTSVRDDTRNSSGRYYRDNRTFSSFINSPLNASIYLYKTFTTADRNPDKDFENSRTKAFANSPQNMQNSSQSDSNEQSRYDKNHRVIKRSSGSRSTTNQKMPFRDDSGNSDFIQDFSGNFKNSTGAVVSIEPSHDRESSRGLFEDPTRLRHTGRGGNKEQIFGYRPDPYHRSHRINMDDERQREGSSDEGSNARNNKSYRRNYATVSSSSQNQGLRDQFLQDLPPRRIARETYNIMSDTLPAEWKKTTVNLL